MNNIIIVVLAGIIVVIASVAIAIWKKIASETKDLRNSLLEAQSQLELERGLRQKERTDNEAFAKKQEAYLKEIMTMTVNNAIERFKTVSGEQLKSNGAEFAELSRKNMQEIFEPLRQRIKDYDEHVDKIHQGNQTLGTELKGFVKAMQDSAVKIKDEATNFCNELKFNNKFQGDFGEERLELVLNHCGLVEGEDFVLQSGDDKRIPDCLVYDRLAKKILIIDAKTSWKDYTTSLGSEDPNVRETALIEHAKSVRKQIDNLASKRYYEAKPNKEGFAYAPFSIMFIPSDGAMMAAIEKDPSLIQYAVDKNVYITSPLNLYNLLRLIKTCLGDFDFAENLTEIAKEAKNVIERIDAMFADFEALGDELRKASEMHGKVMKRFTEGSVDNRGSIRQSANNMIELSVKHDKLKSKAMTQLAQS